MKRLFKTSVAFTMAILLAVSLFSGCTKKTDEPKEERIDDMPAYIAEYVDGFLVVNVNDKESAELVVPCPEDGMLPDSCSNLRTCVYNDGFNNLPKIITAEDYENNILTLVDASGLTTGITNKFTNDFYFAKIDLTASQLSGEDKEEIISKYPIAEFTPIYIFNPEADDRTVREMSLYLDMMGYDTEACLTDLSNIRRIAEDNGISLDITHPAELGEPNHFTKITFAQGIRQINRFCPYEYRYVQSIHIPSSMEFLSTAAFSNMDSLTEITYDGTVDEWIDMLTRSVMDGELFMDLNVSSDVTVKCSDGDHIISATTEQISPWLTYDDCIS